MRGGRPLRGKINIGGAKYCKRDAGAWELVTSSCIGGGAGGVPNPSSFSYSIEKTTLDGLETKLYRQYITYKDTYSANKDKEGLSSYETKYWLNKNGLIVREEINDGLVEPKRLNRVTIDTHEYNPKNLKIEAPIK